MSAEFNKKLMLDNISFKLKETGKKIGELETEAGVSTGYISRTSKDGNTKPGIDFVINVAEALGISVDTLINVNMAGLTPTELYLISFFEKLKKDTVADKLEWNRESEEILNSQNPDMIAYCDHSLFNVETFFEGGETEYPEEVTSVVMISHSFGRHTFIAGDCFNISMKNGAVLYIMNIGKSDHPLFDLDDYAKEVWMYEPNIGNQFLYSNNKKSALAGLVDDLYATVTEFSKHPKIKSGLRDVIDSYMNNDDVEILLEGCK